MCGDDIEAEATIKQSTLNAAVDDAEISDEMKSEFNPSKELNYSHKEAVAVYERIAASSNASSINDELTLSNSSPDIWTYSNDPDVARANRKQSSDTENDQTKAQFVADAVTESFKKAAKKKTKKKSKKIHKLQIAHQTVGRVRMKLSSAKGDTEFLREVAETFSVIPGIQQVDVNPITGSIILRYDDENKYFNEKLAQNLLLINTQQSRMIGSEYDELARKIEKEAEYLAQRSELARAIVDFFKQLDREIKVATYNVIDLKIILAIGALGLMIFEIGATAATPVWLTLSIFTFNHFIELRNPDNQSDMINEEFSPNSKIVFQ